MSLTELRASYIVAVWTMLATGEPEPEVAAVQSLILLTTLVNEVLEAFNGL